VTDSPSRARSEHGRVVAADFFGASSVASALGIRPGATPCGQSMPASRVTAEAGTGRRTEQSSPVGKLR
jgi:hypothetical protein